MAAVESFENVINELSGEERVKLRDFISERSVEMFAARSEDARVRIAHEFIAEIHDRLKKK
jgi:hypothetical protein